VKLTFRVTFTDRWS